MQSLYCRLYDIICAVEEEVLMVSVATQTDEVAELPLGIVVDVETDIRLRRTLDTMQAAHRLSAYEGGSEAVDTSALLGEDEQISAAAANNLKEGHLMSEPEPLPEK